MPERRSIGIGLIGFGWMGQAHSRSYLRIPTLFPEREYDPRLVICADNVASRRDEAAGSFGFAEVTGRRGSTGWSVQEPRSHAWAGSSQKAQARSAAGPAMTLR